MKTKSEKRALRKRFVVSILSLLLVAILPLGTFTACDISNASRGEQGEKGDKGDPGKDGVDGVAGKDGSDGRGILKTEIVDGWLYITYTDAPGHPVKVGRVTEEGDPVGTEGLEFYPLPDGTYGISSGKAKYLSEIIIPATHQGKAVTAILDDGFKNSVNLTKISIPGSVTHIGIGAFQGCSSLISVTIPDGVTRIERSTFADCEKISELVFPVSLNYLDFGIVSGCSDLQAITYMGTPAQWGGIGRDSGWKYGWNGTISCSGASENDDPAARKDKRIFDDAALTAFNKNTTATARQLGKLKIGMICLHDERFTYDLNFINSMKDALKALGMSEEQLVLKTNIAESYACATAIDELVEAKCNVIFATSFGYESYMIAAAKKTPGVQFCHAGGTQSHTVGLANYHNAFASTYEGRYITGIVAGMKLNEMISSGKITAEQAKIGYVGAFPYAEVISGYTAFYLGAKSVCLSVTMEVTFTESWYDEAKEKEAANMLIGRKCVLISQHADSMGAPTACEEAGVPNVSYNGSTKEACPNTALISSGIDWSPYLRYMITCVATGTDIADDFCCGIASGSVKLTGLNTTVAAEGTQKAIDDAIAAFKAGTLKVFDVNRFTVDGLNLVKCMADVDDIGDYKKETNVVWDDAYLESYFRSAPYFDVAIDGITILDN